TANRVPGQCQFRSVRMTALGSRGGPGALLAGPFVQGFAELHAWPASCLWPGRVCCRAAGSRAGRRRTSRVWPMVNVMHNDLAERQLAGATVILAEDDDDTRDLLAFALETYGARVIGAPSARAALALLDSITPTVLVSDISMPGENGYWLVKEMRA